jgi:hypothetical protein
VSLPARDAQTAYDSLLLEAIKLSAKAHQRLQELYRDYPSDDLRETLERFSKASLDLASFEKRHNQQCADTCSDTTLF